MYEKYFIEKTDPYLHKIAEDVLKTKTLESIRRKKAMRIQYTGEVVPAQIVCAFAPNRNKQREIYAMIWGFNIGDPLRVTYSVGIENIAKDPRYKDDYQKHRCVLPASYYIERKHLFANDGSVSVTKSEFVIQPSAADRAYLAGIYRVEDGLPYCILLSSPAPVGDYHSNISDRLPVFLNSSIIDDWLNPESDPKEILKHQLTDFVYEEYVPSYDPTKYWTF